VGTRLLHLACQGAGGPQPCPPSVTPLCSSNISGFIDCKRIKARKTWLSFEVGCDIYTSFLSAIAYPNRHIFAKLWRCPGQISSALISIHFLTKVPWVKRFGWWYIFVDNNVACLDCSIICLINIFEHWLLLLRTVLTLT